MALSYPQMQDILMRELRLYHYPIAVQYFFTDKELEEFKSTRTDYVTPAKSLSYCQWEIAARMQGDVLLGMPDDLSCSGAAVCFGWKELDEAVIKTQLRNTCSPEQAEAFLRAKVCLPLGKLKAIAVMPLAKASKEPSVVHFYCDNMQSLFLGIDYMAATNTHPLRPCMTMNSAACGGGVFAYMEKTFNTLPACFGGYSSGKTERTEVNVFIPGVDIEKTVSRLLKRIGKTELEAETGTPGSSIATNPASPAMPAPFPGADICKNCSRIAFKRR